MPGKMKDRYRPASYTTPFIPGLFSVPRLSPLNAIRTPRLTENGAPAFIIFPPFRGVKHALYQVWSIDYSNPLLLLSLLLSGFFAKNGARHGCIYAPRHIHPRVGAPIKVTREQSIHQLLAATLSLMIPSIN